jgi:hypothetical protein
VKFALLKVLPRAVPVIAACAVLAACDVQVPPDLTPSGIAGTWEGPVGVKGSITFRPDGRFNAVAVDLANGLSSPGCQSVTDTGRWSLLDWREVSIEFDHRACGVTLVTTADSYSSSPAICPEGYGKFHYLCNGYEVSKVS